MENASKALLMAGGLLIAMITISIFYYMFSQISEFRNVTSEDTSETALLAFNQGFESYNKKLMYGTDVISVLNKAIDNNRTYDVESEYDSKYYVDIVFILKSDLTTRTENYKSSDAGTGYEKTGTDSVTTVFKANTEYSLSNYKDEIQTLIIDPSSLTGTYNNSDSSISTYESGCISYKITYYPAAEFKRKTFYCSSVEYNDSGRVSKMTFVETS